MDAGILAWPASLEALTGVTMAEVEDCVRLLHKAVDDAQRLATSSDDKARRAVVLKYSTPERDFASKQPLPDLALILSQ